MIGDAIAVIDFLMKQADKVGVISALFDSDGTRLEGDERITIEKKAVPDKPAMWFYKVKELEDYEFVYSPVIPTLFVDYGQLTGKTNPDARLFRFVSDPMARYATGGAPNVLVKFLVVGYKPKKLLSKSVT